MSGHICTLTVLQVYNIGATYTITDIKGGAALLVGLLLLLLLCWLLLQTCYDGSSCVLFLLSIANSKNIFADLYLISACTVTL